jgi:MoaA/NifB/PqqE/SkfB family radical SAM enzyme
MRDDLQAAVAEARVGDRLWLYATYHCNLACVYCLTESSPRIAARRELPAETLLRAAREGRELGFRSVGVTGGEVFMLRDFPETLVELSGILPTIALTNGMLFTERLLARLEPLAELDAALQISLDAADPAHNDRLRGPGNFTAVVEALERLRDRGITVRIATTVEDQTEDELGRLCELHRALGIPDENHIVRPVVRRGRADVEGLGVDPEANEILPELTLTADGAFLNPFGPTVRHGRTDLDLLVGRQILPLEVPLSSFLRAVDDLPTGDDVVRNIR